MRMSATQSDVARAAGVSQSAVSLALRGVPGVSAGERDRIRRLAGRMGYRPAADAQRLAARRSRSARGGPVIGWINQEDERFWHRHPISRAYWRGASSRARELGYQLEEFWSEGQAPERLATILRHRGIEGLIFPLYGESRFDLGAKPWRPFSCVTLNHPPVRQIHDHVRADFQHNLDCAWGKLAGSGRRIGLVLKRIFDDQTAAITRSRFLFQQQMLPARLRIPPLLVPDVPAAKQKAMAAWARRWKPQILLARDYEAAGLVSGKVEVVQLQLNELTAGCRGIDERNEIIGATAAELVCAKLQHPSRTAPASVREMLIRGRWQESRK